MSASQLQYESVQKLFRSDDCDEVKQRAVERCLHLLPPMDRALLDMRLSAGLSHRKIGSLLGRSPGAVQRRVRKLLNRLTNPIMLALADSSHALPAQYRQVGIGFFIQRVPVSRLARQHDLSLDEVREIIGFIQGWHRGTQPRR